MLKTTTTKSPGRYSESCLCIPSIQDIEVGLSLVLVKSYSERRPSQKQQNSVIMNLPQRVNSLVKRSSERQMEFPMNVSFLSLPMEIQALFLHNLLGGALKLYSQVTTNVF